MASSERGEKRLQNERRSLGVRSPVGREKWVVVDARTHEVLTTVNGYRAASRWADDVDVDVRILPEGDWMAVEGGLDKRIEE